MRLTIVRGVEQGFNLRVLDFDALFKVRSLGKELTDLGSAFLTTTQRTGSQGHDFEALMQASRALTEHVPEGTHAFSEGAAAHAVDYPNLTRNWWSQPIVADGSAGVVLNIGDKTYSLKGPVSEMPASVQDALQAVEGLGWKPA